MTKRARLKEIRDSKEAADSSADDGKELGDIDNQRIITEQQIRKNIRKRLGIPDKE